MQWNDIIQSEKLLITVRKMKLFAFLAENIRYCIPVI